MMIVVDEKMTKRIEISIGLLVSIGLFLACIVDFGLI